MREGGPQVRGGPRKECSEAQNLRSPAGPRQRERRIEIGIGLRDPEVPADLARALPVRVDLLLDPGEGYLTMIRKTAVDTTQPRNDNPETKKAR
jgi:hypothetical protein